MKKNNDRTWFHANRDAWDEHVRHGFEDLVTMLLLAGAQVDDRLAHVDPRACLFRIANDTRFHKEKDPYKTWLSAWMSPGGKNGAFAGYYVHFAPGDSHFSAGIYVPEKPVLHALRSTFADDGGTHALRPHPRGEGDAAVPAARHGAAARHAARLPQAAPAAAADPRAQLPGPADVSDRELADRGAFAVFREAIRATAPFVRWIDAHAEERG